MALGLTAVAAARRPSPFSPAVEIGALIALGVGVLCGGGWLVTARHAARAEVRAVCAREVIAEVRRRPLLRNVVPAAEPCQTLARMRGE